MKITNFLFGIFISQCLHAATVGDLPVDEESPPLYEVGVGLAGAYLPDYPGADQSHSKFVPIPYGVYRGEVVHSDRRGVTRARFLHNDVFEVNVSASGGLPTNSGDNEARHDMPDLDYTGEFGPRLVFRLHKFSNNSTLKLGIPVRAVFSTNFKKGKGQGFIFAPELQYEYPDFAGRDWDLFFLFSVNAADRRYMKYYYEVAPEYATADRPAYAARGGYFASDLTVALRVPAFNRRVQFVSFATLASYEGGANESSPLMKQTTHATVAVAFVWTFLRSKRTALQID